MKKLKKVLAIVVALALAFNMLSVVSVAENEYVSTVYIDSINDFLAFATAEDTDKDGKVYVDTLFVLNIDIDFSELASYLTAFDDDLFPLFSSIDAGFAGVFDGNGHTIYNVDLESTGSNVGLFSYVYGGTVKNLTVKGSATGDGSVGMIAGHIRDTVITNCVSYGTVNGEHMSGGIVGYSYGKVTISNCTNYCDVSITEVWGAGGIVGEIHGDCLISECSNYGDISSDEAGQIGGIVGVLSSGDGVGTIDKCYNCGTVSGPSNIGGIVGNMVSSYSITNCINDGDVLGTDEKIGGIAGYTVNIYSIENCLNNGNVTATESGVYYVGGIVGRTKLSGTVSASVWYDEIYISNCSNTGDIYGNSDYIGGITGDAYDIVMTDCYNTGNVSGRADGGAYIGGITGYLYSDSIVMNCYNEGAVYGYNSTGGVVGYTKSGVIDECYNIADVSGHYATGGVVGFAAESTSLLNSYNTGNVTSTCTSGIASVGGIVGSLWNSYNIESCYNTGIIVVGDDSCSNIGSIFGYINTLGGGTVSSLYYLDTSANSATSSDVTEAISSEMTAKTEKEFNSGEVTYLLNSNSSDDSIWHQTVVGSATDQYPVLNDASLVVVQVTVKLDGDTAALCYTNVNSVLAEYPTSDSGELFFYTDSAFSSKLDKATYIYVQDTTIYASAYSSGHEGADDNDYSEVTGTFNYQSSITGGTESYNFYYNDSWFFNNPYTTYQSELTQMSIRVAMAAFATDEDHTDNSNILDLYSQLGFSDVSSSYPEPQYDTIGYTIGSKTIFSEDGEMATLIAVAIRGGGYGIEWGGNFRITSTGTSLRRIQLVLNNSSAHTGFALAANTVLDAIQDYADTHELQGEVKIWICGYSRAAATANLVGATLIDSTTGNSSGISIDGLSQSGVYTFCFECPQNTTDSTVTDDKYSSIINIINPIDLVTKVAPAKIGFSRYGTTLGLPSLSSTANYENWYKQYMRDEYYSILLNTSANATSENTDELDFFNKITDYEDEHYNPIGESSYYSTRVLGTTTDSERVLLNVANIATAEYSDQASRLDDIFNSMSDSLGYYWKNKYDTIQSDMMAFAANTFAGANLSYSVIALLSTLSGSLSELIDLGFNSSLYCLAHYPELCLAWLDTDVCQTYLEQEFYDGEVRTLYCIVNINCPVDVSVFDDSGTLVAQIISDEVQDIENGIGAYIDSDEQKVLILPTDMEYKVYLTATDSGEVTYTVEQYNFDSGETEKVVSYFQVEVEAGDELVGTVENLTVVNEAVYPLTLNGNELVATVSQTGNVDEFYVSIGYSEGGTVTGGGTYTVGEYAKITATANSGYKFVGWYVNDVLVSTETEYRFLVDSEITIVAIFAESESQTSDIPTVLLTTSANYSAVNDAIAKANALNPDDYTNFADVTAAIEAVDWNLSLMSQSLVNAYAEAIEEAIANLVLVDYTEEVIEIEDPIESTKTDTEPDDSEPEEVAEPQADSNPTTGIAISLIPMAVAALAAVSSKRR